MLPGSASACPGALLTYLPGRPARRASGLPSPPHRQPRRSRTAPGAAPALSGLILNDITQGGGLLDSLLADKQDLSVPLGKKTGQELGATFRHLQGISAVPRPGCRWTRRAAYWFSRAIAAARLFASHRRVLQQPAGRPGILLIHWENPWPPGHSYGAGFRDQLPDLSQLVYKTQLNARIAHAAAFGLMVRAPRPPWLAAGIWQEADIVIGARSALFHAAVWTDQPRHDAL